MDPAYHTWGWVLGISTALGLFIRPGVVIKITIVIFAASLIGLIIAGISSAETLVWVFGMAAMATPVLGTIAVVGTLVGSAVRGFFESARK